MPTRILTSDDCEQLLDRGELLDWLATAHRQLSTGGAVQPIPQHLRSATDAAADAPAIVPMSAYAPYLDLVAVKVLVDAPRNRLARLPPQRSTISLYSAETGECLALIDGRALTRIRTAAVTALASRTLATPAAKSVGLIGAGPLAVEHVTQLRGVFDLQMVRVWSPGGDSAARLAADLRLSGVNAEAVYSPEFAVRDLDIVCTLTPSRQPIVRADWLHSGIHLNAIGSPPRPGYREVHTDVYSRADTVVVDVAAIALHESDNVREAVARGSLDPESLVDLGDVLAGLAPGRRNPADITVFNSVGIGLQDLAAAAYLLQRAEATGTGDVVQTRPQPASLAAPA